MVTPHPDAQLLYPDRFAEDPLAVHVNTDAPVVVVDKPPEVISPLHRYSSPVVEPTGVGFTFTSAKKVVPAHPVEVTVGVTVYLTCDAVELLVFVKV